MDTLAKRLRFSMKQRHLTEQKIATALDVAQPTVNAWVNGRANPKRKRMDMLAHLLNVDIVWLEFGGPPPINLVGNRGIHLQEAGVSETGMVAIAELDVRVSAGDGVLVEGQETVAHWMMPASFLHSQIGEHSGDLRIITVVGDSMIPDFLPGERVMVDITDKRPSPPGTFVLWDGIGLVVKKIEYIHDANNPRLRIISKNPDYSTREESLESVYIQGRVIGKWHWT